MDAENTTVERFCAAINASLELDRTERRKALEGLKVPVGYRGVDLYDAKTGRLHSGAASRSEGHRLDALNVAINMRLGRSSNARPRKNAGAVSGVLDLMVDVDHEALNARFLR